MKKVLLPILFGILLVGLTACQTAEVESQEGVFQDENRGVSFEYPSHWETRTSDTGRISFAANFDYFDGLSKSSKSTELEGSLSYQVIANPEGKSLQDYYNDYYDECLSQILAEELDFGGPGCTNKDFSEWESGEVNGYESFLSEWFGTPASGEMVKELVVDLDDQDEFLILMAIKTGVTDEEGIDVIFEKATETLSVQ